MSFLLDTDIISAYMKNHRQVVSKVMLHFGGLNVSTITMGELLVWARRKAAPARRLIEARLFFSVSTIHEVDQAAAERFAELRAEMLDSGRAVGVLDLFNAAIALTRQLTMVTHNTSDYAGIPGLVVEDWMGD
jgi:tRNA(fMet)-specific endonuclease VapC